MNIKFWSPLNPMHTYRQLCLQCWGALWLWGNQMAACLSPWPVAEPAIFDTTTLEGWDMTGTKQLYLTVFSQQESYSSWLIWPPNFNLSPEFLPLDPTYSSIWVEHPGHYALADVPLSDLGPSLCGERCFVEWDSLPTDRGFGWSSGEANSPYLNYVEGRT